MIDDEFIEEHCTEEGTILNNTEFDDALEVICNDHELKPWAICCFCSYCHSLALNTMTHIKFNPNFTDYYLIEIGKRMESFYRRPKEFNRKLFQANICKNSRLDAKRNYYRKQGKEDPIADIYFNKKKTQHNPLKNMIKGESRQIILEEFEKLPPKQKYIVWECYVKGRTQDDLAKELGYSNRSSINGILKKTRETLKKRLDEIYKI